jgi:ketosteroid isomerase-like protein
VSNVSIHPSTVTNFLDRLQPAFEEGDGEVHNKRAESDNVKRLQEQYQGLARGDFAPVLALLADDVEMEMLGPAGVPMTGRWCGKEQVAQAIARNFSLVKDQNAELLSVVAQGDSVVLFARETGRYRATGKSYDIHWVQLYTFRDGRVARFRGLFDTAAMLQAAGAC